MTQITVIKQCHENSILCSHYMCYIHTCTVRFCSARMNYTIYTLLVHLIHAYIYCHHSTIYIQVLLTNNDFTNLKSRDNLHKTMNALLSMKVIPILNGNDVVAPPPQISVDLADVSVNLSK